MNAPEASRTVRYSEWVDERVTDDQIPDMVYDDRGLIPAIAQDRATGRVLMLAWMDQEALRRTLESGRATYWSRSRQSYWVKGETSGHVQRVHEVRRDCDSDAILVIVDQTGPACHTGQPTCFDVHPPLFPAPTASPKEDHAPVSA